MHIIGSFPNHSKAVTCLTYCASENLLVSGSKDGMVRVWNPKSRNFVRMFKHAKENCSTQVSVCLQLCNRPQESRDLYYPLRWKNTEIQQQMKIQLLRPVLTSPMAGAAWMFHTCLLRRYLIKEFQNRGSSASELEMERLKADCKRSVQRVDRFKKMYEDLQEFYKDDFLKSGQTKTSDETGN